MCNDAERPQIECTLGLSGIRPSVDVFQEWSVGSGFYHHEAFFSCLPADQAENKIA